MNNLMFYIIRDDEDWQTHRSALNQHMMRPKNVATHLDDFKEVTTDFLSLLDRDFSGGKPIDKFRERLFSWSFEGKYIHCLKRPV